MYHFFTVHLTKSGKYNNNSPIILIPEITVTFLECADLISDHSFSWWSLCYRVLAPEPPGCWRFPNLVPVPSRTPRKSSCIQSSLKAGPASLCPLGEQNLSVVPAAPPGSALCHSRLEGQSLGLLMFMAGSLWVTPVTSEEKLLSSQTRMVIQCTHLTPTRSSHPFLQ